MGKASKFDLMLGVGNAASRNETAIRKWTRPLPPDWLKAGRPFPFSDNQLRFINSDKPHVGIAGSVGAGKSFALMAYLTKNAMEHPGIRIWVFRREYKAAQTTIVEEFTAYADDMRREIGRAHV